MGWKHDGYYRGDRRITHWKKLRDADGLKILADPRRLIDWFDDFLGSHPYVALSNYFVGNPFVVDGVEWASGEHAFAGGKAATETGRKKVIAAQTPDDAKVIGRSIRLRPDWSSYRLVHMRKIVLAKFTVAREEGQVLLATGSATLVEGTLWHDDFWGVDLEEPGRPGRNELGKILMRRREQMLG
jgi:ribA/ribD-fused uncharacterized protein